MPLAPPIFIFRMPVCIGDYIHALLISVVTVRRSTWGAALSLPVHRLSSVFFVQKSAGNSKLNKVTIDFSISVKRVCNAELGWDRFGTICGSLWTPG